ncbi:hypothetical protein MKS88_001065 [Plasmodium brasilianum]|uniref:Uncharacterized protein n=1 Tax=Plasmodium brasilianum TaxID=5824 RepID=A0ACB9YDU2_PLABR|nr:hypothetical protein MKS88_001065 [Plasmodium brasilianum]
MKSKYASFSNLIQSKHFRASVRTLTCLLLLNIQHFILPQEKSYSLLPLSKIYSDRGLVEKPPTHWKTGIWSDDKKSPSSKLGGNFDKSNELLDRLRYTVKNYINKDTISEKRREKKENAFNENYGSNLKLSEAELKKKVDDLYFFVTIKDMHDIWYHIYDRRRCVYIEMMKKIWDKCVEFAEKKNISKKILIKTWWSAYSDFMVELQKFDADSLSNFIDLYKGKPCTRYKFIELLNKNKSDWKEITEKMKNKWKKQLHTKLKHHAK